MADDAAPEEGRLNITLKDAQGEPYTIDDAHLMKDLQANGATPIGISADGLKMTFQGAKGPYEAPIEHVLKTMGHNDFEIEPTKPNSEHVNPAWRAEINNLSDDDAKKAFLESKMRREGIEQPQVIGKGRDWYAYHPAMGQWLALTNDKNSWGLPDVAEGAQDVVHGLGSVVGGALGGGAGFFGGAGAGSIPGAMVGSALGGGAVDATTQAAMAALDPDYRDAYGSHVGSQIAHTGLGAGADALGAGAFGAAARYGGPAARAVMQTGLGSTAAKTVAALGEHASGLASSIGEMTSGGGIPARLIRGLLNPIPGQGYVDLAQAAADSPLLFTRAVHAVANTLPEEAAGSLRTFADGLLKKRGASDLGSQAASFIKGGPKGTVEGAIEDAQPLLKDWGGNAAEKLSKMVLPDPGAASEEAMQKAVMRGLSTDASSQLPKSVGKYGQEAAEEVASKNAPLIKKFSKAGEVAGQGLENISRVANAADKAIDLPMRLGASALEYGGKAAQLGFRGIKNVATAVQPMENYLAANAGLRSGANEAEDDFSSWLKRRDRAKMFGNNGVVASND